MMKTAAAVALTLVLAGCVETVKFSSLAPTPDNIARAFAAEQALTHPQTVAGRQYGGADRVSICLSGDDQSVELTNSRIEDGKVCGEPTGPSGSRLGSTARVCYAMAELESVGLPRDAKTFGYYPVRGWLECRGEK